MEREEKRLAKEKEKERKASERQSKAEERKRIAEQKKNERLEKCKQREERCKQNGSRKKLERLDRSGDDTGIQTNEISNSECAACFGLYEEDILSTGELVQEWVECTECKQWMHSQCVQLADQELLACCVCGSVFQ